MGRVTYDCGVSSPEVHVCNRCGRVLDHEEGVGFIHTISDANADHEPEPVPVSEALVVAGRCDFCTRDFPEWVVPASEFEVTPGHMSGDDWAACNECAALIEKDQWNALIRRAKAGWEDRNGPMPAELEGSIPRLYRLLRRHITGSIKPNPSLVARGGTTAKYGIGWKATPGGEAPNRSS